jgi:hypothetical protein
MNADDTDRKNQILPRMNADERGSEEIAGIAVIARHRRNRKGKISPRRHGDTEKIGDRKNQKTLPLMNADKRGSGKQKSEPQRTRRNTER